MGYLVFSRKYRPQNFDELWAQDHVKQTLKNAVEKGRIAHGYLFAGPRGVGKTTTARILAKSLNCEQGPTPNPCGRCPACQEITTSRSLDVLEVDGASNRGIDEIRDLRENIKYTPARGRYKIYIIDEVHMLTEQAFNALLKTLEEPPPHAIFIFATTAPFKVPPTIQSRCQRFDFRRVSADEIVERLRWITGQEKIAIDEDALYAVARRAEGSIRDAESILDQVSAYSPDDVTLARVEEVLGVVPGDIYHEYSRLLKSRDDPGLVRFVNRILDQGFDLMEFYTGLLAHFRQLLLVKMGVDTQTLGLSRSQRADFKTLGAAFSEDEVVKILEFLYQSEDALKRSLAPSAHLEVLSLHLVRLVGPARENPPEDAGQSVEGMPPGIVKRSFEGSPPGTAVRSGKGSPSGAAQHSRTGDSVNEQETSSAAGGPPAAETGPAANRAIDLGRAWQRLVEEVRSKRPALASSLERAIPLGLENNLLRVSIPARPAVPREMIAEGKPLIDATLTAILGLPVTAAFEASAENGSTGPGGAVTPGSASDPMYRRIVEIFDGEEVGR